MWCPQKMRTEQKKIQTNPGPFRYQQNIPKRPLLLYIFPLGPDDDGDNDNDLQLLTQQNVD